ncbi:MAG: hypothetical protein ACJ797_11900 [Ktedonobacteraceae bacterium]
MAKRVLSGFSSSSSHYALALLDSFERLRKRLYNPLSDFCAYPGLTSSSIAITSAYLEDENPVELQLEAVLGI